MAGPRCGLARALSKLGRCSRAQAERWIIAGRVTLNGVVCLAPEHPVVLERDRLAVDGVPVGPAERVYLMLNKPRGLITTAHDEQGRDTVYRCFGQARLPWIAPVGRLDAASEGLLLFTNDSGWAARILDPRSHLDKVYHVQVAGLPRAELPALLTTGVHCTGERLAARAVSVLRQGGRNAWLEIVLDEGRNRHIRRMLEAVQLPVLRLVRVAVGPLWLGDLPKGAYRLLDAAERRQLDPAGAHPATDAGRCTDD